jgi:hypothetical protein
VIILSIVRQIPPNNEIIIHHTPEHIQTVAKGKNSLSNDIEIDKMVKARQGGTLK